jgi:hypothetical protein
MRAASQVSLEKLSPASLRAVLTEASGITDPLSIELIKALADANSPIWADELPTSKFSQSQQLSKLDRLVDLKVARSAMAKHGNSYVRKYYVTDFGKTVSTIVRRKA